MSRKFDKKEGYIANPVKTELLAPAGNYESFLGAVHAGADAVYLAGQKFGARAYAGNFSTEELCRAIRYAHLSDRKVYLTLNTLIKEAEFSEIHDYLMPFYEEGLDGIIVQDMGVLRYVKEEFPSLPLHISTQAMVTGVEGARFLKEQGAVRVVPARELSLAEICRIKEETGLELETFIHGAMCYCYSGQCLFSSIAGGRSGNRGRCAQPCRLPYQLNINGRKEFLKESYPLSLKDMCTIQDLPALLSAGIDSFKIEGRMKKPEYAAGVTAIYRKYIDAWYENPMKEYRVDTNDLQKLSSLYIRSEVQNGYYFRHNGKEMITLESPAYSGSDDKLLEQIRKEYLTPERKTNISLHLYCKIGEPLLLTLYTENDSCVSVEGDVVERAQKQPLDIENIRDRICRFGNTFFEVEDCQIEADSDCFIPVKSLNELRREAALQLEDAILKQKRDILNNAIENKNISVSKKDIIEPHKEQGFSVYIQSEEQLEVCLSYMDNISRIYIEGDLLLEKEGPISATLFAAKTNNPVLQIYAALPFILRARDIQYLEKLKNVLQRAFIDGCLVRNVEELGFMQKNFSDKKIALDAGMYVFNEKSIEFYKTYAESVCLPYELNFSEKKQLLKQNEGQGFEQVIYGRIPMMVTANCLAKTLEKCTKQSQFVTLTDRYKHDFPVQTVCEHCYNIIWNCLPLSLHNRLEDYAACLKRLQFTSENKQETEAILEYFLKNYQAGSYNNNAPAGTKKKPEKEDFPLKEYTTGHEKRGVE